MKRQPNLYHIYVFFSLASGWVHCTYVLAYSYEDLVTRHPRYSDKHVYLITGGR